MLDANDPHTIKNAGMMVFGFGLVFTIITTKVIISTMAQMEYTFAQLETLIFVPYLLIQHYYSGSDKMYYQSLAFIIGFLVIALLYIKFVRT